MINLGTYRKELSLDLCSIFEDVRQIADICCDFSHDICSKEREIDLSIRLRGEVHQLAVVLQYEDIISQSFLSFDAISEEIKKISDGKTVMSFEEHEKFSGVIKAVVENTVALITGSLENIDIRLGKLGDIVAGYKTIPNNYSASFTDCTKMISNLRKRVDVLISRVDKNGFSVLSEELPVFSSAAGSGKRKSSVVKRLSKSFRVVEHKQILNCFFPGESSPGETGVLEIF
jgi:hypothetical protein